MPAKRKSTAARQVDSISQLSALIQSPPPPAGRESIIGPAAFFTQVSSNIKGGVNVRLGQCTAIVGDNRAHKTAVLDTVRLAIRGEHPIGLHGGDLLALSDGESLIAKVSGPDARSVVTIPKGKKTVEVVREGLIGTLNDEDLLRVLPLVALSELLKRAPGETKGRQEFFRRFGGGKQFGAPEMTDGQKNVWDEVWAELTGQSGGVFGLDSADELTKMADAFRKRKLAAGREKKAKENELIERKAEMETLGDVTDDVVRAAEQRYQKAALWARMHILPARKAQLEETIKEIVARAHATGLIDLPPEHDEVASTERLAEIERLKALVGPAESAAIEAARNVPLIETVVTTRKAVQPGAACITCLAAIDHAQHATIQASLPDAETLLRDMQARVAALQTEAKLTKKRVSEAEMRHAQILATETGAHQGRLISRTKISDAILTAQREIADIEQTLASMGLAGDPGITELEAKAEHERLIQAKAKVDSVSVLKGRIREMDEVQAAYKKLEEVTTAFLTETVEGLKGEAETAVNRYMPEGFKAVLHLADGDYRWEVVGSDGQPHRMGAMSGAERGALMVALACGWTEGAPVRIVLIDDTDIAGFSPANVAHFLTRLREHVEAGVLTQVIVAWSRPSEIPGDWSVVER